MCAAYSMKKKEMKNVMRIQKKKIEVISSIWANKKNFKSNWANIQHSNFMHIPKKTVHSFTKSK